MIGIMPLRQALSGQQDIAVLSSDEYGLIIEMTLPAFRMEEVKGPGGVYKRIDLPGWARTSRAGSPDLPLKSLLIQTPLEGKADIRIVEDAYECLPDCLIYPVPRPVNTDKGEIYREFFIDNAVYDLQGFFPGRLAEIDSQGMLRDTHFSRITINPFQWNPATKELRYFTRIRIIIEFETPLLRDSSVSLAGQQLRAKPIPGFSGYEDIAEHLLINYQQDNSRFLQSPHTMETSIEKYTSVRMEIKQDGIYRYELMNGDSDVNKDGEITPMDALCAFESYLGICPTACGIPCEAVNSDVNGDGVCTPEDALEIFKGYLEIYPNACAPFPIDLETLRLTYQGEEVAIKVISKRGDRVSPGDSIEFYGEGMDNTLTDTMVYWLSPGKTKGKRVSYINGGITVQGEITDSFKGHLHFEENHEIWPSMPGAQDEDCWFWEKITAPKTREYLVKIPSIDRKQTEATIKIGFRGRSTASPHPNHHTVIYLNGTKIGDAFWDGTIAYIQEMTISSDILIDGNNTVRIESPGDTGATLDIIYLNWIEIDFHRLLEAVEDKLTFAIDKEGCSQIEVKRLSSPDVIICNITDPNDVKEVLNFSIQADGPEYKAVFQEMISCPNTYLIQAASLIKKPEKVELWQPGNLKNPQKGADHIIITPRGFLPAVEPLRLLRQNQGLRAIAVSAEDIYNEFSFGIFDPSAIKDFLRYTFENWIPPAPTYVLLIGDANLDYRDYYGTEKQNRVPAHLSITEIGLTPDDNWYVCVQGEDILPDMFIGRIPGDRAETVSGIVNKIISHEASLSDLQKSVMLVADNIDPGFETLNDDLVYYLPPGYTTRKVYLDQFGIVDDATQAIISGINSGVMITNYVGHGSVQNWAGEMLFEYSDLASLTNEDNLTFLITMTCLNGFFSQPFYYCLAEGFISAQNSGAFACFSPSSTSYLWEHKILNREIFSRIFGQGQDSLGYITTQSKIASYANGCTGEMVSSFTLFGDPAGKIK